MLRKQSPIQMLDIMPENAAKDCSSEADNSIKISDNNNLHLNNGHGSQSHPLPPDNCQCGIYIQKLLQKLNQLEMHEQLKRSYSPKHRSSKMSTIKREFFRFCENTTIRGVPRIVKARTQSLRILWSVFVIILFFGLLTCIILLSNQYFAYDVIHPPRILKNSTSPFPAITVCNLRALKPSDLIYLNNQNENKPRDFANNMLYAVKSYQNEDKRPLSQAMSMAGFLGSISKSSRDQLGHQQDKMIWNCDVTYRVNTTVTSSNHCNRMGTWQKMIHPQYLNCYTYNVHEEYRDFVKTISMRAYLDQNVTSTKCDDCFRNEIFSQLSGLALNVHVFNSVPDMNDAIKLHPGTLTEINIKTFENTRMEPPYGRCSPETPKTLHLRGQDFAYTEYACKVMKIQESLNTNCHCNGLEFGELNETLPYCLDFKEFVPKDGCVYNSTGKTNSNSTQCEEVLLRGLERIKCKNKELQKFAGDVIEGCKEPCSYYSYESDRSTSIWPTHSYKLQMLESLKKDYNWPEIQKYREARKLLGPDRDIEAIELIEKDGQLEKNLLGVLLNKANLDLHKVEEKEVLSMTSFMSQIGGLLSIWVGLTMISIVELIEFLLNCSGILEKPEKANANSHAVVKPEKKRLAKQPTSS
ncbi:sodium channel, non-voltage-gated 1, gamma [Cichlidogyrus casuarinus]|uniref:Sodium channel, non-voltage-gated 1, gamma n=1 Tax=Cichlidogyrus casuarinus TaxID=1844966 RepID=A0ABD2QAD4_9PLAT